ncbi:hypothetical protein V8C40DRAFT_282447 [Trichoderma camerunense]
MDTNASVQKEEKGDCRNPKDESSTIDGSESPILLESDDELVIVEPLGQPHRPRRANKRAVTVEDGEELLQKPTSSRKRAASPSPSSSPKRKKVKFAPADSICKQEVDVKSEKKTSHNLNVPTKELFPIDERTFNDASLFVRMELMATYTRERHSWFNEMREEFLRIAPGMNFWMDPKAPGIPDHSISLDAHGNGATWIHFWFLRVIYGPYACSKQSWFPDLAEKYPWILEESRPGVVPADAQMLLNIGASCWVNFRPLAETPEIPERENIDTPNRYLDKGTGKTTSNETAPDESFCCCSPGPSSPIIGRFDI